MSKKNGFTLIELCVGVILMGIAFSISFSFFNQMLRTSSYYFKSQLEELEYSLRILQEEQQIRMKCILFYTAYEMEAKDTYKLKAANRCRF